ncbi:MAG: hypothetical protein PF484_13065 [Bacteroidales bacterium]|jgi:hypothetical protein|nr:hypothetical protein [Bacteroidales bacterium]
MINTIKKISLILLIYSILISVLDLIKDKFDVYELPIQLDQILLLFLNLIVAYFYYKTQDPKNKVNSILLFLSIFSPYSGGMMIIFYNYLERNQIKTKNSYDE